MIAEIYENLIRNPRVKADYPPEWILFTPKNSQCMHHVCILVINCAFTNMGVVRHYGHENCFAALSQSLPAMGTFLQRRRLVVRSLNEARPDRCVCLICYDDRPASIVCPSCLQKNRHDEDELVRKYMIIKRVVGEDVGRMIAEYSVHFLRRAKGTKMNAG
jgi:hypothetical protein